MTDSIIVQVEGAMDGVRVRRIEGVRIERGNPDGCRAKQVSVLQRYSGLVEVSRDPGRSLLGLVMCATGQLTLLRERTQKEKVGR